MAALHERGGFCDCEVEVNAFPDDGDGLDDAVDPWADEGEQADLGDEHSSTAATRWPPPGFIPLCTHGPYRW